MESPWGAGMAGAGAGGTIKLALQAGHWTWKPLLLISQTMCWPQWGQGNLKSLINIKYTIELANRE
ncbi:MAG: hypothetical protein JWQ71_4546 [Pedosphaera sp.]|nr:hypothetical protein [Pedosphaera sp.]